MSDITNTPEPAGRGRVRVALGASLLAIALAAGGFYAGRATAPDGGADAGCKTVQAAEQRAEKALATTSPNTAERAHHFRTGLNLVIQNPGCYTAEQRAQAQAILDQAARDGQAADAQMQCEALAEHWWDC